MREPKSIFDGRIITVDFPKDQYFSKPEDVFVKKMICLHHSAGWDDARAMFRYWSKDKARVATCCGINDKGQIIQGYSSKYYAWHINVWSKGNQLPEYMKNVRMNASYYEKHSIGVEVTNFGPLQSRGGTLYAWPNDYGLKGKGVIINPEVTPVVRYDEGFRGFKHYEAYTERQIDTLYDLCSYWMNRYDIPFKFKGKDHFFNVNIEAVGGDSGIHTHAGFRTDKFDMHPQPELVQMLQALSQ